MTIIIMSKEGKLGVATTSGVISVNGLTHKIQPVNCSLLNQLQRCFVPFMNPSDKTFEVNLDEMY